MDLNNDGVDDAVEDNIRVAVAVATELGRALARAREQMNRDRVDPVSNEQARDAALANLAPVNDKDWWEQATAADIGRVHETATAWAEQEPAAAAAIETIREEVLDRYGVDTAEPGADVAFVVGEVARIQAERAAEVERGRGVDDVADSGRHERAADDFDATAAEARGEAAQDGDAGPADPAGSGDGDSGSDEERAATVIPESPSPVLVGAPEGANADAPLTESGRPSSRDETGNVAVAERAEDAAASHRSAAAGAYNAGEQHKAWAASMEGKAPQEAIDSAAVVEQAYRRPVTSVAHRAAGAEPAAVPASATAVHEISQQATRTQRR